MNRRPPQRSDVPPEPATFEVTAGGSWPGRPGAALPKPVPTVGVWQPISDYRPEIGRVLVWLAWFQKPQYDNGHMTGAALFADRYTLSSTLGADPTVTANYKDRPVVWMPADKDTWEGLPLEMHERRVTHFCQVRGPA